MENRSILGPEQIASFQRDGYLVVRGLFNPYLPELLSWTQEVTDLPEVPGKYMMYFEKSKLDESRIISRIEDFIPYHQAFSDFCLGPLQQACAELLGEPAVLFKDKINYKLPGGEGYKAHQDSQAGWLQYGPLHLTAMVALDPANEGNGRLEMVAGRHQEGLIGPLWEPLPEDMCQQMEWIPVDCEPGDAVFFDSFAPHRSEPNLSNDARRILYITYNRASEGDQRRQYYDDKRASYPPDVEREDGKDYSYKV